MNKCPNCENRLQEGIAVYYFKTYGHIMTCSLCIGTFFRYLVNKNIIIEKLDENSITEICGFGSCDYD